MVCVQTPPVSNFLVCQSSIHHGHNLALQAVPFLHKMCNYFPFLLSAYIFPRSTEYSVLLDISHVVAANGQKE